MHQQDHGAEKWLRFLRWYCPPALYEGIEGDVREKYKNDVAQVGEKLARKRLAWEVIRFFRPDIILRNKFSIVLINTIMLRNYLTIAFRNVFKSKVFSAINVFGLGIGLAACLLIFQYVTFELSFDKFNEKFDRIYRVTNDRFQNGKLIQHGTIMYPTIGPTMAKDYPEVEAYTRMMPNGDMNIKAEDRFFRGDNAHYADEHFLSVFSYPLLAGQRDTALKERHSMVLTETVAKKYFGVPDKNYASVIGKVVYEGLDPDPYKITGVLADLPENSHLRFGALISYSSLISPEEHGADDSWTWSDMRHYLLLKPGADYKQLESKFVDFSEHYFKGDKVTGSVEKFYLQPLNQAHLYSNYEYDIAVTANGKAVWAMLIVAGFILLIAWINYINLTTSRAVDRAKEVGLRKVMGALKTQLVKQFIFESLLISFLAFVVAVILVQLAQNPFNQIMGGQLSLWKVFAAIDTPTMMILSCMLFAGVLLSGFYPAFVLSSYQPAVVLKGKFQRSFRGQFLRKALVIFQFATSAALITGTIIVSRQLTFMNKADLGLQIQNTLVVRGPERTEWDSTFIGRIESYKQELSRLNKVVSVATSQRLPGSRLGRSFGIRLSDQPSDSHFTMSSMGVDYNFFDTYKVPMLAGRNFLSTDHKANWDDINVAIINVNAVHLLGIEDAQSAIGKELVWGKKAQNADRLMTIVGVVGNFHQESLKNPMEPIAFRPVYSTYAPASIKLRPGDPKETIAEVETIYKKLFPGNAFEYFFMEDRYNNQYKDDNRFGTIISIFTVLAIIISCLGLIGLSSYTAVQRTKEIGIRKVLGASLVSIVSLLSVDFIKLVLFATLVSLPIAYFAMQNWLEGYAYRVSLGWMLFLVPVIVIVVIATLTMSFQVMKTAMTNPADTLKYE